MQIFHESSLCLVKHAHCQSIWKKLLKKYKYFLFCPLTHLFDVRITLGWWIKSLSARKDKADLSFRPTIIVCIDTKQMNRTIFYARVIKQSTKQRDPRTNYVYVAKSYFKNLFVQQVKKFPAFL
jgi:hypothetical protein